MRQNHTHCASAANKKRLLSFYNKDFYRITSLPSHFSLPSLQNQRKSPPVWGLTTSLDVKEKLANFNLNIYFRGSTSCWLVLSLHVRSHILYSCEPWDLLWGFVLWGAGMVQTVSAYVWALNIDLKLHHKETTDLPRVHWSLLSYCSVGNKKILNLKRHLSHLKTS